MAVRSDIKYIGEFVRRKLGLGSYLRVDVTASSTPTSVFVLQPELFDPDGGTLHWVSNTTDKFFTYSGVDGDELVGIPATGSGRVDADMAGFSSSLPTLVYRGVVDDEELERSIDRFRFYVDAYELDEDLEKKKYWFGRGWLGTDVSIRDSDDLSFNLVTPNTANYERGEFEFTVARTEDSLFLAGYIYNPWYVCADLIQVLPIDYQMVNYFVRQESVWLPRSVGEIRDRSKVVAMVKRSLKDAVAFFQMQGWFQAQIMAKR